MESFDKTKKISLGKKITVSNLILTVIIFISIMTMEFYLRKNSIPQDNTDFIDPTKYMNFYPSAHKLINENDLLCNNTESHLAPNCTNKL